LFGQLQKKIHLKVKVNKNFSNRFQLQFGAEYFITDYTDTFSAPNSDGLDSGFNDNLFGAFAEADVFQVLKLLCEVCSLPAPSARIDSINRTKASNSPLTSMTPSRSWTRGTSCQRLWCPASSCTFVQ
jgi:hypothetical protein